MADVNYYVFRVNYDEDFSFIHSELEKGILRQGWGAPGMRIDAPKEQFISAWKERWPVGANDETAEARMKRKYNNLRIMTEMKAGDLIVIPKLSMEHNYVDSFFTIVRCVKSYNFSFADGYDDFGHYLTVTHLLSCPYDYNDFSQTICAKFTAYRAAVNHAYSIEFGAAVDKLLELKTNGEIFFNPDNGDYLKIISDATVSARNSYLNSIVKKMQTWPPKTFENIIQKLFESNGYIKTRGNDYDRKGGDIDIVLSPYKDKTLIGDIYELTGKTIAPDIHIQAKKKTGKDTDDIKGIEQLLERQKDTGEKNILIVINLTDEFSEEAQKKAEDNDVLLLNGSKFASLLVRYGIDVQI